MEAHSNPNAIADLPYALAKAGRIDEARKAVAELVLIVLNGRLDWMKHPVLRVEILSA